MARMDPNDIAVRAAAMYGKMADEIDYDEDIETAYELAQTPRLSTRCLVLDLLMNGGLPPCWCQFAGDEGSAKTTNALSMLSASLHLPMLYRDFHDAENALNTDYALDVMGINEKAEKIFGRQDPKNPKVWLHPAQIRHRTSNQLEPVLNSIFRKLNRLPDKAYRDGRWFYIFSAETDDQRRMKELGLIPDKTLSTRKRFWCELPDHMAGLQSVTVVDSLPALVPTTFAEDEKEGGGMGLQARLFSSHIPKISGILKRKFSAIVVMNHVGLKPGEKYNPEYEKGGNSPKFYSAIRMWNYTRAVPEPFEKLASNRRLCAEQSAEGTGEDWYAFKEIKSVKMKWGQPFLKGWQRIWIKDRRGFARGIDPVYDLWEYLKLTHQVKGPMNGFTIEFVGEQPLPKLKWMEFKRLVLAEVCESSNFHKSEWVDIFGESEPFFKIYAFASKQNARKKAQELTTINASAMSEDDVPDDD